MISLTTKITAWLMASGLLMATIVPAHERPVTGINHNYEHFIAFAVTAVAFAFAYRSRIVQLFPAGFMFTLILELLQIPLPTRHARVSDFVDDTSAVFFGLIAGLLLLRLSTRMLSFARNFAN